MSRWPVSDRGMLGSVAGVGSFVQPVLHVERAELSAEAGDIPPEVTACRPERGLHQAGVRPPLERGQRYADCPGGDSCRHVRLGHLPRVPHPVQTLQTPRHIGVIAAFAAFSYIENVEFVEFIRLRKATAPAGLAPRPCTGRTAS